MTEYFPNLENGTDMQVHQTQVDVTRASTYGAIANQLNMYNRETENSYNKDATHI